MTSPMTRGDSPLDRGYNRLYDEPIAPDAAAEARAVRYICGSANDAKDARFLIAALGLQP